MIPPYGFICITLVHMPHRAVLNPNNTFCIPAPPSTFELFLSIYNLLVVSCHNADLSFFCCSPLWDVRMMKLRVSIAFLSIFLDLSKKNTFFVFKTKCKTAFYLLEINTGVVWFMITNIAPWEFQNQNCTTCYLNYDCWFLVWTFFSISYIF